MSYKSRQKELERALNAVIKEATSEPVKPVVKPARRYGYTPNSQR